MAEKMYYIMDTYGSYYMVTSSSRISATTNPALATKFTLAKANNVIQNMIKPNQRYQYVLKEAEEKGHEVVEYVESDSGDYVETRLDDMSLDWNSYIGEVIDITSQLRQYRSNLSYMLSQVDKEICDIMHYIEFFNLDAARGYKVYKMLKERRLRRRQIKDEFEKVSAVIQAMGDEPFLQKMNTCLRQMEGLDRRQYEPRVLVELFE